MTSSALPSDGPVEAADGELTVVYVRFKDPENLKFIYRLVAETDRSMRDIVERMAAYCRKSKGFAVPVKEADALEKKLAAKHRRIERYRRLAGE